ncbi:MAG: hypothetical protein ACK6DV_09835, partial [Deltaproteobacteria bacterium]
MIPVGVDIYLGTQPVDLRWGFDRLCGVISRSSDAHGSTIHYRYRRDRGQLYLSDISYVSPHACAGNAACTEAL